MIKSELTREMPPSSNVPHAAFCCNAQHLEAAYTSFVFFPLGLLLWLKCGKLHLQQIWDILQCNDAWNGWQRPLAAKCAPLSARVWVILWQMEGALEKTVSPPVSDLKTVSFSKVFKGFLIFLPSKVLGAHRHHSDRSKLTAQRVWGGEMHRKKSIKRVWGNVTVCENEKMQYGVCFAVFVSRVSLSH